MLVRKINTSPGFSCVFVCFSQVKGINRIWREITLKRGNTLGLIPKVHCISHTAPSCYDSNPFSPIPLHLSITPPPPFITSRSLLWLKERVMENRIRSQEDIWLHSLSVFESFHRIPSETLHVSNLTPATLHPLPSPPMWQEYRGLIGTCGELLKDA